LIRIVDDSKQKARARRGVPGLSSHINAPQHFLAANEPSCPSQ